MNVSASLVHHVNGLIWEEAVVHVSVCKLYACFQCFVCVAHIMMLFVFLLDVMQNLQCLFCRSRFYDDLLESTLQSTILFNTLAIFVEGGGSDALDEATCQSWFHDVGSIHTSFCTTRTNQRVDFIDENDDVRVSFQFLDDALDALLKLTSIFGAGNNACYVET